MRRPKFSDPAVSFGHRMVWQGITRVSATITVSLYLVPLSSSPGLGGAHPLSDPDPPQDSERSGSLLSDDTRGRRRRQDLLPSSECWCRLLAAQQGAPVKEFTKGPQDMVDSGQGCGSGALCYVVVLRRSQFYLNPLIWFLRTVHCACPILTTGIPLLFGRGASKSTTQGGIFDLNMYLRTF